MIGKNLKANYVSRRERQILDVLYELKEASVQQVLEKLADPPGYSSVRALMRKLEEKGHIAHKEQGAKYVYYPLVDSGEASRNAIQRLVRTFFDGSKGNAVNAMLGMSMKDLSDEDLDALETKIKEARNNKRK
jgi:predicted transcriptional regulator